MIDRSSQEQHLACIQEAAEAAMLAASDADIADAGAADTARAVVTNVLRSAGFEADGTMRLSRWRRARQGHRATGAGKRARPAPSQQLLSATFDSGRRGDDDAGDDE